MSSGSRITPAWEGSEGKAESGGTLALHWSTGVTPGGRLSLGLTLRR